MCPGGDLPNGIRPSRVASPNRGPSTLTELRCARMPRRMKSTITGVNAERALETMMRTGTSASSRMSRRHNIRWRPSWATTPGTSWLSGSRTRRAAGHSTLPPAIRADSQAMLARGASRGVARARKVDGRMATTASTSPGRSRNERVPIPRSASNATPSTRDVPHREKPGI